MKKKIFFCIGTQKGGTTSLHDIMNQNKNIALPLQKETHFFSVEELNKNGLEHYFNAYFDKSELIDCTLIGEIDPSYCFFKGTAKRIYDQLKSDYEVKFIFILRDPVKRAFSHFLMSQRRGYEKNSFEYAVKNENNRLGDNFGYVNFSYICRGYYSSQIKEYLKYFNIEQFLFLRFEEDFINDRVQTLRKIHEFLNLKPFKYNLDLKSNVASEPRSKFLRNLTYSENIVKSTLSHLVWSKRLREKIKRYINKKNFKPARNQYLSKALYKELHERYYQQERRLLSELTELDFPSWNKFY